jgi:hypothetical protein
MKNHNEHFYVMFFIMILAGTLSTMNNWVNKLSDIRFSLNDLYMIFLMTGYMLLFMGIYYKNFYGFIIGLLLVILNFLAIRNQFMITEEQYLLGMIPHHSMAILMSKKLMLKNNNINNLLNDIVKNQENEINFMKSKL